MELLDATQRRRLPDGTLAVNEGPVNGVAFSPDGKTIRDGLWRS